MAGKAWADAEVLLLESLAGYQTVETIAQRLNRVNTKAGRPHRTARAVRAKLAKIGLSSRREFDNFSKEKIVRLLKISERRVTRWIEKFELPARKGSHAITVKTEDFKAWAYEKPQQLYGIDADRLNWLMEDLEFCKRCERLPSPTYGVKQAIVRCSDGKVFESIEAAAKANYVGARNLRTALKTGQNCLGSKWRYRDRDGSNQALRA
jgi:hypothetical protein